MSPLAEPCSGGRCCTQAVEPSSLAFMQAQDGNLHVVVWPSAESSKNCYPVFKRDPRPQPVMFKKDPKSGQLLTEVVTELCVLP